MAVGLRIKLEGVSAEQMDRLNAEVRPGGRVPAGLIFHASSPIEGGFGVLDFWESREQFDRFAQDVLGPAMAAAGVQAGPPEVHEFPVHEYFQDLRPYTSVVGISLTLEGLTLEEFDRLNEAIDPRTDQPDGLLFHASGPVEGGWGVLDFWDTRERFEQFASERMGPAMAPSGVAGTPLIREFPVHEHFPA